MILMHEQKKTKTGGRVLIPEMLESGRREAKFENTVAEGRVLEQ